MAFCVFGRLTRVLGKRVVEGNQHLVKGLVRVQMQGVYCKGLVIVLGVYILVRSACRFGILRMGWKEGFFVKGLVSEL